LFQSGWCGKLVGKRTASSQIDSLTTRQKAYYNIDGVGELGIGFMMLGYGLLAWLQSHSPETGIANSMHFFIAYMIAMLSAIHFGSNAIKSRITYHRTGYVEYLDRDKLWIPLALGFGISTLFSVGLYIALGRHWEINAFRRIGRITIRCGLHADRDDGPLEVGRFRPDGGSEARDFGASCGLTRHAREQ